MHTLQKEIIRKGIHLLLAGGFALLAYWVSKEILIGCAFALFVFFALLRVARLHTYMHGVARITFGELFFALGLVGAIYVALPDVVLFQLSMAILALADPLAAFVGMRFGTHKYYVFDEVRSVEGSVTCGVVAFGILMFFGISVGVSVLVASLLTAIEAVSLRGSDNLFLPLSTLILLQIFVG